MNCRLCHSDNVRNIIHLGKTPIANGYLENLDDSYPTYDLILIACEDCEFFQTSVTIPRNEIFSASYSYLSSVSSSWKYHLEDLASEIRFLNSNLIVDDTEKSLVVEIGVNDGGCLEFLSKDEFNRIGIEPALIPAQIAKSKGIEIENDFFGLLKAEEIVKKHGKANIIVANNVIGHVPDLYDFFSGICELLKHSGIIIIEIPSLEILFYRNQYDTIYHEHYSYFTLNSFLKLCKVFNLKLVKFDLIETHGGSFRFYVSFNDEYDYFSSQVLLPKEMLDFKISRIMSWQDKLDESKDFFFTWYSKNRSKRICGYGAAAKANTFMNFIGITNSHIDGIFDASNSKQGKFMPGSHIPILDVGDLEIVNPDILIIFVWNIKNEIIYFLSEHTKWHGTVVFFHPFFEEIEI